MAFRKLLMPLAVMLFLLVPQGCSISYKLNGAAIDYTVYKTINVGEFPIRAALVYAPLQQMFENELLDYITRNTRLTTVDSASDLELEGEITGYNLTPAGCHGGCICVENASYNHCQGEIYRY